MSKGTKLKVMVRLCGGLIETAANKTYYDIEDVEKHLDEGWEIIKQEIFYKENIDELRIVTILKNTNAVTGEYSVH